MYKRGMPSPAKSADSARWQAVTQDPRPSLYELRPDLPVEIDDWLDLVLAIDREKRFQNVRAMWSAFAGIIG